MELEKERVEMKWEGKRRQLILKWILYLKTSRNDYGTGRNCVVNNVLGPEVSYSSDNPIRNEADLFHWDSELTLVKNVLKSFFRRTPVADQAVITQKKTTN